MGVACPQKLVFNENFYIYDTYHSQSLDIDTIACDVVLNVAVGDIMTTSTGEELNHASFDDITVSVKGGDVTVIDVVTCEVVKPFVENVCKKNFKTKH